MSRSDPYLYPRSGVLRNKLGLRDEALLATMERALVAQRISEGAPSGDFDLDHRCAIHRHLFQDVYDWAGEVRRVELAKGGDQFQFRKFIPTGMADVHRRRISANCLKGLDGPRFAREAAAIIGDINYIHPFREGNGRVQVQYLKLLAENAGRRLDLTMLDPARWLAASRAAHRGDYTLLATEIGSASH